MELYNFPQDLKAPPEPRPLRSPAPAALTASWGKLAQLSRSELGAFPGQQKRTTAVKMSLFPNKFSAYTMTQLNEFLEDDEKLTKMVLEMEEVG